MSQFFSVLIAHPLKFKQENQFLVNIRILNKLLEREDVLLFSCLFLGIHILVSVFFLPTQEPLLFCPAFNTTGEVCFVKNPTIKIGKQQNKRTFCSMPEFISESRLSLSYILEIILFNFNNNLFPSRLGLIITQPSHQGAGIFCYTDNLPPTTFQQACLHCESLQYQFLRASQNSGVGLMSQTTLCHYFCEMTLEIFQTICLICSFHFCVCSCMVC